MLTGRPAKAAGLAQTGVCDGLTAAFILAAYGAPKTGSGITENDLNTAIKEHAAAATAHPHRHDEGRTGGPQPL